MSSDRFVIQYQKIRIVPIIHSTLELATIIHDEIKERPPQAIAVEYPQSLYPQLTEAIRRLPYLSVVLYENSQGERVIIQVEPCDPLVEASRSALERHIPLHFVDLDIDYLARHDESLPDPYAIFRLGLEPYWQAYRASGCALVTTPADQRREQCMAHHLQELQAKYDDILFVCGLAHVPAILERLTAPQPHPLGRVKRSKVRLYNLSESSSKEVMAEWPYLSASYEESRTGRKLPRPIPPPPPAPAPVEPEYSEPEPDIPDSIFNLTTEQLLKMLLKSKRRQLRLVHDNPAPQKQSDYRIPTMPFPLDRQRLIFQLYEQAAANHELNSGEKIKPYQWRTLRIFSRNYALVSGRLLPNFYQILISARNAVDDNYSFEVWDLGSHYPWQDQSGRYETIDIHGDEIWTKTQKIHFHRRFRTRRQLQARLPVRLRPKEKKPGEWRQEFDQDIICSYPPEDIVIENFGQYLGQKAKSILSEMNTRVTPFSTSLQDGIDIRETIRNWHVNRKIYIKEQQLIQGKVGAVVVIFDEDREDSRYPWCMTWNGEHYQESDMAFYATPMDEHLVGPGIARCEYGGFLLSYPPMRMLDIWRDPYYAFVHSKPERLLISGIDYAAEKFVVYVAAKPPRSAIYDFAAKFGRKIIYIPIGQLSPITIKKLRVMHVLSGHEKREIARDYIW
jgi:hypothetical protein